MLRKIAILYLFFFFFFQQVFIEGLLCVDTARRGECKGEQTGMILAGTDLTI